MLMSKKEYIALGKWIKNHSYLEIPATQVDKYFEQLEKLEAENKRLKEGINYAIDGIDALLPEETEARKDMLAIKQTLEKTLKNK